MERFTFRKGITLADIAEATGIDAVDLRLTEYEDGSIDVVTPSLTAPNRTQLRALFVAKGFKEDTG